MAKDPEQLLAEWIGILERLKTDIWRMHGHRYLWQQVNAAVHTAAPPGALATWPRHYLQIYAQSQAVAIRRIVHPANGAWALGDLLERLAQRPDVVTPERVAPDSEGVPAGVVEGQRQWVLDNWCGPDGHLDPARPKADRERLYAEADEVIEWVNTRLAHIDPRAGDRPVALGTLDSALDDVSKVFVDYSVLLTNTEPILLPVIQDDWTAIFANPLFPRS